MFKLVLEKGEEPEIRWIMEKAREFQKNIYFCFIDYAKAFDCVDHKNCGKFKRWEYQTTLPACCKTCMLVKKHQVDTDMEQWMVPNWERNMSRLYIDFHPVYLTYI